MKNPKETISSLKKRLEEHVIELMERSAEASEWKEEAKRLRTAIEIHRDQTGHNICWINDEKLWAALGDGKSAYPRSNMPTQEEFLVGCRAYIKSRFKDIPAKKKDAKKKMADADVIKMSYKRKPAS